MSHRELMTEEQFVAAMEKQAAETFGQTCFIQIISQDEMVAIMKQILVGAFGLQFGIKATEKGTEYFTVAAYPLENRHLQ